MALGLVAPTVDGYRATEFGDHMRLAIRDDEPFGAMGSYLRRLFAFAVMREFEEPILTALEVLRRASRPLSSRNYCKRKTCGESEWRKDSETETGAVRCPTCHTRAVVPAMYLQEANAAEGRTAIRVRRRHP